MEKLIINGGKKLYGKVNIPAAKNAILPILAASLMLDGESCIYPCPKLSDIEVSADIIEALGSTAVFQGKKFTVFYKDSGIYQIPEVLCGKMRSGILYLSPVLYRCGKAVLYMPGGCNIGARPVDIHLDGLKKLGAQVECDGDKITVTAPYGLKGTQIKLRLPSVGATQTLMMAAVTAKGLTVLKNCAREPEIVDLARFLNCAGAKITGAGRNEIIIQGVSSLKGAEYTPIPDRIVAATVLAAVNASKGTCVVTNYPVEYMQQFENLLKTTGLGIVHYSDNALVYKCAHIKSDIDVHTGFYPAFSTDTGPLLSAALANNKGTLNLCETVFENRFSYKDDFLKLGINCRVDGRTYIQNGYSECDDIQQLQAKDLRAGAALVVAAIAKKGNFEITGLNYIDRGYENIEEIFSALGADIRRIQLD